MLSTALHSVMVAEMNLTQILSKGAQSLKSCGGGEPQAYMAISRRGKSSVQKERCRGRGMGDQSKRAHTPLSCLQGLSHFPPLGPVLLL